MAVLVNVTASRHYAVAEPVAHIDPSEIMSTYRLNTLFAPRSVAVVGASPREKSTGRAVLRNLQRGGFQGGIHLVNPNYNSIDGISAVKSYDRLADAPDLAVVAAPPQAVPGVVAAAAAKGTAACIILTAGLGHGSGSLAEQCESTARAAGMRLVGPNCLGVQVPGVKLNASFAASMPRPGDLALISQSGAIATGLVEWAAVRDIGFSGVVSIGDSIDVDMADLLDFFAMDRATRAILLYVEFDQGRAQIHVGGARRGARQAGSRHQDRPPRARRQGGHDAYRRACRIGRGL